MGEQRSMGIDIPSRSPIVVLPTLPQQILADILVGGKGAHIVDGGFRAVAVKSLGRPF